MVFSLAYRTQDARFVDIDGEIHEASISEFPKIRGTLSWSPYYKDPTIWGAIFGSPISETPQGAGYYGPSGTPRNLRGHREEI